MTRAPLIIVTLQRLVKAVVVEATKNPDFASSLEEALGIREEQQPKRPHRRAPGVVDPFAMYADAGEESVRRSLSQLSIEQLKDIVAQHGMDRSKLAMKWRTSDRFIELILETVAARNQKGDAFR